MRSFALSTGSSGNCFYVESSNNIRILVDLGLSYARIDEILESRGVDIKSIDAVFITHEHADHIAGLKTFANRVDCPIYISKGTYEEVSGMKVKDKSERFEIIKHHTTFKIDDLRVLALDKDHDAKEALCFVFENGKKLGVFTDLGEVSDEILHVMKTLDVVYFEANYCEKYVKKHGKDLSSHYLNRLMSDVGHLGLHQTCEALSKTCHNMQKIILSHISENTNSYENSYLQVKEALAKVGRYPEILVGFHGEPSEWID